MREHGVILGRDKAGKLKVFKGDQHCILHAMSGAGKSVGFSIPNAFAWKGSLVCLDVKRELFQHTSGWRASCGQEVYLFDPAAPDGRSHRWNPFWQVDRNSPDRFDQISRMSFQLWPEALGANTGNTDFWNAAAREAFCTVANLVAETPAERLTMANVLRVFMRGGASEWLEKQVDKMRERGTPYSSLVAEGVEGHLSTKSELADGIRKTVTTRLQIWSNPRVAAATSETDFDLRDIRRKEMAIYVGVSPGDIPRNAPLLRLFFDSLLNVNTSQTPEQDPLLMVPVLLLLDEFAQLGRMDRLAYALQYARGYGIRMALVVQNRAQIMNVYGSYGATDVFDNVGCEMIYGTGDHVLADQIEKRMGDYTVNVVTKNRPMWMAWLNVSKQTAAEHPHRRPLMLRQEVLQMPRDEQIVLVPGMEPAILKKIMWFREPQLGELRLPTPRVPELQVHIPLDSGARTTPPVPPPLTLVASAPLPQP